jgi:hypothetical protein
MLAEHVRGGDATFLISWSQVELDGLPGRHAAPETLGMGSTFRWTGDAVRVPHLLTPLVLGAAPKPAERRRIATQTARRLVRSAILPGMCLTPTLPEDRRTVESEIALTDGVRIYTLSLIEVAQTGARLLVALEEELPPPGQDLWVVRISLAADLPEPLDEAPGIICFAAGTLIRTPHGAVPIDQLRPGDRVETKDNGPQEVLWIGHRRMSGARLYAMPELRPIRLRAGAFGNGLPADDLLVSPQHRILVGTPAVAGLFRTSEVLVAARDLLNGTSVKVDHSARDVTYIHLLLEHHNVLWANGVETESFHPARADLASAAPEEFFALKSLFPDIVADPSLYGADARRMLDPAEAAILRHETAA